ncbi:exportin-4-like isoform X2 [Clytia hemisphaerica]|uniref:Exportin-4 n=1 Tax=Clytia hemisphaerica TaxID=252671 RepID=A0A7M5V5V5_9CNID|eukprot:TCONS_00008426-protein
MANVVAEMEKAAAILMAHPGLVTSEERQHAEQLFLEFRKTKQPYEICQSILKSCTVEYVIFEAATTLKEAVIREWSLLEKSEVEQLCGFLLQTVTEKVEFPNFVREQILLAVAVIFKLGTLESPDARTNLINGLNELLTSGNKNMELICCSIMKALLTEYSTTSQSTNFGMSLDFHAKCKKTFEEKDLLNLFILTINALQKYTSAPISSLGREDIAILNRYLSLAEQIFLWEFMSGNPLLLLRFPHLNETASKLIFKPHKNWKEMMLNPNLIDMFFQLLQVTSSHNELSHHCFQCLIQLASVAGGVFGTDDMQLKYLSHYMNCLLNVVDKHEWSAHQASGLASIIFRLVDVFPMKIIRGISDDILNRLFEAMMFLTCMFLEKAATAPKDVLEDNEYAEGSNTLLDAWITVISHSDDFPPDMFKKHSKVVVEAYIKCHLGAPEGIRPPDAIDNEDLDHELSEKDRDFFSDELSNIGQFFRMNIRETVPLLKDKLNKRVDHLQEYLNYERMRKSNSTNGNNRIASDVLFEDLNWLLLIATFVLTVDTTGESAQVPNEIVDCSNDFLTSHQSCVASSVRYLTTIGKEGNVAEVDPCVGLFTSVLRVVEIQNEFLNSNLVASYSPEIASTVLWFLKRWTRGYLPGYSAQLKNAPVLSACFDVTKECGSLMLKVILETAELNLYCWTGEPDVTQDVSSLLLRIFHDKKRVGIALALPTVWTIVKKFSSFDQKIMSLSPKVQRNIIEALMQACMQVQDPKTKEEFQTQLLKPIMDNYLKVRQQDNFNRVSQNEEVKYTVIRTLECLRGIFPTCFASFSDTLFQYFQPLIEDTVALILIYESYTVIIVAILEMYVDMMEHVLCFLNSKNTTTLCRITIDMMKNYSKITKSIKKTDNDQEDEEQYNDLLLLIQLLSHILSKDFLDLGDTKENEDSVSPVDIVLYGLQIVIPLITQELLKYPKLSSEYFKLVTFVCEVYPEKLKVLPEELFKSFMASIQMAISDLNTEVAKCSLDALSSLAKYLHNECDRNDPINLPLHNALLHFLNMVFEHIVLGHFNMELIEPAAECFFLLICCHQEEYLKLANNLIAKQHVTNETFKQRLIDAFQLLTPVGLQLSPNRQSLRQFRKNLETFLQNVKGFLCFK